MCAGCDTNFNLALSGLLCSPICNDTNCDICSSPAAGDCTSCKTGYAVSSGVCNKIICNILYCISCSSTTTCTGCQSFYTLASNKCTPTCASSVTNCFRCSSDTQCSLCNAGYTLSGNTCSAICSISSCSVCATSTTCALCNTNYALNSGKTLCLLTCSVTNCKTCNSTTDCQTCNTGYNRVTASGKTYCVPICPTGYVNTGTAASPTCQLCSTAISNCNSCQEGTSGVVCTSCPTGYYLEGTGKACTLCSSVISHCWTCSGPTTCKECMNNYYYLSGSCVAKGCDSTVKNCNYCQSSPTSCTTCNNGFTNTGGACTITCSPTFVYDKTSGTCICPVGNYLLNSKCAVCPDNCYSCDSTQCYKCADAFYPSGLTCLDCGLNCKNCTSATNCVTCQTSFYPADGVCVALSSNIQTGAAAASDGTVYQCPTGCAQCTVT